MLVPAQRGVYVMEQGNVDDFVLLQQRFKKGIFSHETALYLWGLSERIPIQFTMTFKHGRSSSSIKNQGVKPIMVSSDFTKGEVKMCRDGGVIRVYDIERTLVDLFKPRYDVDYEQLIPALKVYVTLDGKDINKLFRYARQAGVDQKLQGYIGVLL